MNSQPNQSMPPSRLEQDREELTVLVEQYARTEGVTETAWSALSFFRADSPGDRSCAMYEPCLGLLLQGNKHILFGDERFEQENGQYRNGLSVRLPLSLSPLLCGTGAPRGSLFLH